jgi:hypothetical protein
MEKKEFIEGVHFYLDSGKVVFTEAYFLQRGTCCGNKCRHCPFTKPAVKGNKELEKSKKI